MHKKLLVITLKFTVYREVFFRTKKMWPYKTGDLLKEVHTERSSLGQRKCGLIRQVTS